MQTEGQTDMTKLIVAFSNSANAPENYLTRICFSRTNMQTFDLQTLKRLRQHIRGKNEISLIRQSILHHVGLSFDSLFSAKWFLSFFHQNMYQYWDIYRNRVTVSPDALMSPQITSRSVSDFISGRQVPTTIPHKFLSESHFQLCIQAWKRRYNTRTKSTVKYLAGTTHTH
jgi:hypothetical protein